MQPVQLLHASPDCFHPLALDLSFIGSVPLLLTADLILYIHIYTYK